MIKLLSLETATDRGGFCLWSGARDAGVLTSDLVVSQMCPSGQPHAETLLPLLRAALDEAGWQLHDLDAIVYDAGPGMFTGLRVAAALAQGLAVASSKPLVPVSSLEALAESAYQQTGETSVLTLLDARMNQIYAAAWRRAADQHWTATMDPCLINPDALSDMPLTGSYAVAGTALDAYPEAAQWCRVAGLRDTTIRYPATEALAYAGAVRYLCGVRQDPAEAVPVYVRERVALTTAERATGQRL